MVKRVARRVAPFTPHGSARKSVIGDRTGKELVMWCGETSAKKAGKGTHVAFRFDGLIAPRAQQGEGAERLRAAPARARRGRLLILD